ELSLFTQTGRAKEFVPIQSRRLHAKIGLAPCIVRLLDVLALRQTHVLPSDRVSQRDDAPGAQLSVRNLGELEQSGYVYLILFARVAHLSRIGQVVFAVRHLQTTLHQVSGVVTGIVKT